MARPKTATTDTTIIEMEPAQAQQLTEIQQDGTERTALILRQFGDGLPFDEARYEHIIRGHLARSAEEMLFAGRSLIVAKEMLGHGQWMPFVERIGLGYKVAAKMMQAAFKFSNVSATRHLIEAAGTRTKLFELLALDDEEIKELSDGGTVAGLELDDIAKMPTSELRKKLRDNKEEKKAADTLLAEKNAKIDSLTAELRKARTHYEKSSVDEKTEALAKAVTGAALDIEAQIRITLRGVVEQFLALNPAGTTTVAGHATMIRQTLDDVCGEFAIPAMRTVTPDWATEA